MKLIFTGHNDRYAIEQDLLAFFPTERPVYDPDAAEENCAWVKLSEGSAYTTATTRIRYQGREGRGLSRVRIDPALTPYQQEGLRQRALKMSFFKAAVEIMGRDARNYPREELRSKAAMVMQKAQLFGGTIRSNLLWGNQNASDADLWAALETAQAAEFVKAKPLGLDEPVDQGGRNLSGGQKQRLTIARALVGKPDILILDDSASALDYATDAALRKALAALPGDLTVFIVSQRAASLQHADQIIVLDDGRMVGLGRHAELLESCPVYKEIYESQFKKGDAQK